MGLKQDLINAKLIAWNAKEPTEQMVREAELTRDAIINFLTSDKLYWTITELKASVELEEFSTTAKTDANMKKNMFIDNKESLISGIKRLGDTLSPPTPNSPPGTPGLGTLQSIKIKRDVIKESKELEKESVEIPPLNYKKNGQTSMGGFLKSKGHAYVGIKDPTPNSDTTDSENEFTKVKLIKSKIPESIK